MSTNASPTKKSAAVIATTYMTEFYDHYDKQASEQAVLLLLFGMDTTFGNYFNTIADWAEAINTYDGTEPFVTFVTAIFSDIYASATITNSFSKAQTIFSYLLDKIITSGEAGIIISYGTGETTLGNNNMLTYMADLCNATTGACDTFLTKNCPTWATSRGVVASNPMLQTWCGCYAPLPEVPGLDNMVYGHPCDPLCTAENTIHLYYSPSAATATNAPFTQQNCDDVNVCIMDNISVKAVNNVTNNGAIVLNQICPACYDNANERCICVVDVTVPGILNKISAGTNNAGMSNPVIFNQWCPNAECINVDPLTGKSEVVSCGGIKTITYPSNVQSSTILFVVGIFIILMVFFLATHHAGNQMKAIAPGKLIAPKYEGPPIPRTFRAPHMRLNT